MSLVAVRARQLAPGFPRVSGDEPHGVGSVHAARLFSPRERG